MGGFLQRLHLGLDSLDVIALGSLFQGCSSILYLTLGGSIHLVAQLAQRAAGGVNQVLSLVPGLHFFLLLAVLASVGLSILTICSTSCSERPLELLISMVCSLPVAVSLADTCTIPLASISKVTSICGMPRGAGGIPVSWNLPRVWLYMASSRSPCRT